MRIKKSAVVVALVGVIGALGATTAVAGPGGRAEGPSDLSVFVRDVVQTVDENAGGAGAGQGDTFTFHGNVFDKKGGKQIGRYGGICTTLGGKAGLPEDQSCTADYILPKGQILTRGIAPTKSLFGGKTVDTAVLGGTGAYTGAHGSGTFRIPTDVANQTDGFVTFDLS